MAVSTVRSNRRSAVRSRTDKIVIADAIRSIARELRSTGLATDDPHGVTKARVDVLKALQGVSSLSINELADLTYTHQSSVSAIVGRLVADGLVKRGRSPDDRRRVSVTILPKGRSALRKAPRSSEERLLKALGRLNPAELADVAGCLSKISAILDDGVA